MNYQEFIEKNSLEMQVQPAPANPHMQGSKDMDHWYVTVTRNGYNGTQEDKREMTLYFSQGHAHRGKPANLPMDCLNLRKKHDGYIMMPRTQAEHTWNKHCQPTPPELEDILDCLASDSAAVENARDFEDFAAEFGYDEDSREAEKTYRVCQEQSVRLFDLLGEDAYDTLLWDMERL